MSAPEVKGWCPGAHRPMRSEDGLVVRVRPRLMRLDRDQILGLCDLAQTFGAGGIDLTNRANLQIRGVTDAGHEQVLKRLALLDLLDVDPQVETRRNVISHPFWQPGDATARLTSALFDTLPDLPELPAKVGFAVDLGPAPVLQTASADFRFEHSASGLILRADGATHGRPVTLETAMDALHEMVAWFNARRTADLRRMSTVLKVHDLPRDWSTIAPLSAAPRPVPGQQTGGIVLGAEFGRINATDLARLVRTSQATGIRLTPWRLLLLETENTVDVTGTGFIDSPDDPRLRIHACAGAPLCPQASVATEDLARRLAGQIPGVLHVSGCAKACALPRASDVALVGRDGAFDLVLNGAPWNDPVHSGLSPDRITDLSEWT